VQQPEPGDYVVATGETHSVREFTELAFKKTGVVIEWSGQGINEVGKDQSSGAIRVRIDRQFFRPAEVDYLVGDYAKARKNLGWSPRVSFAELVGLMAEHDLASVR
jgi:GDPmannose 4,6-dehydratase